MDCRTQDKCVQQAWGCLREGHAASGSLGLATHPASREGLRRQPCQAAQKTSGICCWPQIRGAPESTGCEAQRKGFQTQEQTHPSDPLPRPVPGPLWRRPQQTWLEFQIFPLVCLSTEVSRPESCAETLQCADVEISLLATRKKERGGGRGRERERKGERGR